MTKRSSKRPLCASFIRSAFLAMAILPFALPAFADNGLYVIWSHGSDSCGSYAQEYKTRSPNGSSQLFLLQASWIAGWISHGNAEWAATVARKISPDKVGKPGFDLLLDMDADGLLKWVDNFCDAHPLDNLATAATALEAALLDRIAPKHGTKR
jgi:hypothetical protein